MRRRLVTAAALLLTATVMLTACSAARKPHRENNRSDNDGSNGFTRPSVTETETSASAVPFASQVQSTFWDNYDPDIAAAYAVVLSAHEDGIREFEDNFHSWRCPSICLLDLDGDGVDELMFKYVTEPCYANFEVYSYDETSGEAVLRFRTLGETETGSWGCSNDIVLLDDGKIMISNYYGSGGEYHYWIALYDAAAEGDYPNVDLWELEEQMPDMSADCVPVSAAHNAVSCTTDAFYAAQADMVSRIAAPILPYTSRCYYDDYTVRDIFGRDWNAIPGSVFEQGSYMFFDDYMLAVQ